MKTISIVETLIPSILITLSVLLSVCGLPEERCLPSMGLGSCCNEDSDCQRLECLTNYPNGLCTQSCENKEACPDNGICTEVNYSGQQGVIGHYCLIRCGEGFLPCRKGYSCRLIPGTDIQVCHP